MDKIMKNKRGFLEITMQIQKASTIQECAELVVMAWRFKDFNLLINTYAVFLNKRIVIDKKVIIEESTNWIISQLKKIMLEQLFTMTDIEECVTYLLLIQKIITISFSNTEGCFEREEVCYNSMKEKLLENKFTQKYSIELPYLYVLVCNIQWLYNFSTHGNMVKSRTGVTTKNNVKHCIKKLSDTMIEIAIGKDVIDGVITIPYKKSDEFPDYMEVNFSQVLPSICCVKEKKELTTDILNSIPLVPVELICGDSMAIEFLFESLKLAIELDAEKKELSKNSELLREAVDSKNDIVDRHHHNWKHISYPTTVKEVADKLASDDNYKTYANKLFKAYNSENILKQEVLILKLKHSGNSEDLQRQIMSDVLLSNSRTGLTIQKIIEDSLDIVLFRILMEDVDTSTDTNKVKNSLSVFTELIQLRESYTKNFIVKEIEGAQLIKWFNENIYPIVINVDENWQDVRIKKEGVAYAQLVEICIDLFHNAINYGKKDKNSIIKIDLCTELVEDSSYLTLKVTNPIDYTNILEVGSGKGLSSLKKLLEKINYIADKALNPIPTIISGYEGANNEYFETKIYFKQQLLLKRI